MKAGDKIMDNDPRITDIYGRRRILEIVHIGYDYVFARVSGSRRNTRIRKDRIFTDDKERRSGYSLVKE